MLIMTDHIIAKLDSINFILFFHFPTMWIPRLFSAIVIFLRYFAKLSSTYG